MKFSFFNNINNTSIEAIKQEMKEALSDFGDNPNSVEGTRAKVKYNMLKNLLEELYLKEKILSLPEELRSEIGKFIKGQRKIDNLANRK
jgi:hypothetical protein